MPKLKSEECLAVWSLTHNNMNTLFVPILIQKMYTYSLKRPERLKYINTMDGWTYTYRLWIYEV